MKIHAITVEEGSEVRVGHTVCVNDGDEMRGTFPVRAIQLLHDGLGTVEVRVTIYWATYKYGVETGEDEAEISLEAVEW